MAIRVLDPTSGVSPIAANVAPSPGSLEGRTVGLLDNSKVNVKQLLNHIEILLKERYGVERVVRLRKEDPSRPAPPDVVAALEGVDAFVSAVGD